MNKNQKLKKIHAQESKRQDKRINNLKDRFGKYSATIYFTKASEDTLNELSTNNLRTKDENKKEKYCIIINELIQRLSIETHFSAILKKNKIAQELYQSHLLISNYLYEGKNIPYIKNKLKKKNITPPNNYNEWSEQCILEMSSIDYIINNLHKFNHK
ncbi:hypothetical protein [Morganella morganii]|uniref:hypothetical protein n=1 Tax=Morganella morganii TaxID=582 RepID=UPI000468586E|nr:hypothetical protein [Morganella morganii]